MILIHLVPHFQRPCSYTKTVSLVYDRCFRVWIFTCSEKITITNYSTKRLRLHFFFCLLQAVVKTALRRFVAVVLAAVCQLQHTNRLKVSTMSLSLHKAASGIDTCWIRALYSWKFYSKGMAGKIAIRCQFG